MNGKNLEASYCNRDFVARVRAELATAGRSDVAIERIWIDEDTPGHPFLLHVPIGAELMAPLKPLDGFFNASTDEQRTQHAREFAMALINLKSAEKMLTSYVGRVRRGAVAAVAAARADGLDVLLEGIGLTPTYAHHLTYASWKEAAYGVLAKVAIRHTSFYLHRETSNLIVDEPDDVARELEELLEEQRERQERIAELEARGADLEVDAITLELLATHGLNAADLLRRVWSERRVNLTVQHLGRDASLSLSGCDGKVTASLHLPDAAWNGEHMWLLDEALASRNEGMVGKALGDLVSHPVFRSRPIVAVHERGVSLFSFDMSDTSLFDADTGRIWREERLAA